MTKRRPIEDRFWPKVRMAGALECWEWTAAASHGYGVFADNRKRHRAHRIAYELMIAPIPPLLVLDHLCKNTLCVNPYHLDPVPLAVNSARSDAGQVNRERILAERYCIRGHDLTDPSVARVTVEGFRVCRACKRARYAAGLDSKRPRSKTGPKPKLSLADVSTVDSLRALGVSWPKIADAMGVNESTVWYAGHRRGAYRDYPRET